MAVQKRFNPSDSAIYSRLQKEQAAKSYGAKNRTARAFGVSHTHIDNVLRRYTPAPELAYEPPPNAYPDPVVPVVEVATDALLQDLIADEIATEPATDLQHVMSPSVQSATPEPATLQFLNVNRYVLDFHLPALQVAQFNPWSMLLLLWFPTLGVTIRNAVHMLLLGWWWTYIIGILLIVAAVGMCIGIARLLDRWWPSWRGWSVVIVLAIAVVVLAIAL